MKTAIGNLTMPLFADGSIPEGHVAKILVTDFSFSQKSLLYSTAKIAKIAWILTYATFDGQPTLAFWSQLGEAGQFLIKGASRDPVGF